jgi:predicted helicase
MHVARYTVAQISKELGNAISTIRKDIDAIESEWRASMLTSMQAHQMRELASLDQLESEVMGEWEKTKSMQCIQTALKIKEQRAKILGLYQPFIHVHTTLDKAIGEMSDSELAAAYSKLEMEGAYVDVPTIPKPVDLPRLNGSTEPTKH